MDTITIHYHRPLGDYDGWELWVWSAPDRNGRAVAASMRDDFGLVFRIDAEPDVRTGILPRKGAWEEKDPPDRYWSRQDGPEIWILSGRSGFAPIRLDTSPFVVGAWIDSPSTLAVWLSVPLAPASLSAGLFRIESPVDGRPVGVLTARPGGDPEGATGLGLLEVELQLDRPLDLLIDNVWGMRLTVEGYRPIHLLPRRVLDGPEFSSDAEMGAVCTEASTRFRVFAPTASQVSVNLYPTARGGVAEGHPMKRGSRGLWELVIPGDLEGRYYTLTAGGLDPRFDTGRELIDPYSRCNTAHDGRSLLFRDRTPVADPPDFPKEEAIVYELHIRDFTIADDSGVTEKGKYLGLVEAGTRLTTDPTIATGLDHLIELGINAVQLMPIQDFENDEAKDSYAWGYMPVHFNSPDGWYATRVDGPSRVIETKTMIDVLHKNGIKVILDVVYNHTAELPPKRIYSFEGLAPGYYYRLRKDGSLWDGSGTGNEFRTEAPMARKYVIDSLAYWVTEYKVDGFRFDLMGLIDEDTVDLIIGRLRALKPNIVLYGEPWTGGQTPSKGPRKGTQRGRGFAVFNDAFRDAVKGGVFEDRPGFVQDGSLSPGVRQGLKGSIDTFALDPFESVNYVESHDNQTLWDRLLRTVGSRSGITDSELRRMHLLASAIVLFAQGLPFLQSGQEMFRTKGGSENSYDEPDSVNRIDWSRKKENSFAVAWFREVIRIRRDHPMFRLPTASQVRTQFHWLDQDLGLSIPAPAVGFQLLGEADDPWESAVVLLHPGAEAIETELPPGDWWVFVRGEAARASRPLDEAPVVGSVSVPGRSAVVLARPRRT